jgi:hypothetical protein
MTEAFVTPGRLYHLGVSDRQVSAMYRMCFGCVKGAGRLGDARRRSEIFRKLTRTNRRRHAAAIQQRHGIRAGPLVWMLGAGDAHRAHRHPDADHRATRRAVPGRAPSGRSTTVVMGDSARPGAPAGGEACELDYASIHPSCSSAVTSRSKTARVRSTWCQSPNRTARTIRLSASSRTSQPTSFERSMENCLVCPPCMSRFVKIMVCVGSNKPLCGEEPRTPSLGKEYRKAQFSQRNGCRGCKLFVTTPQNIGHLTGFGRSSSSHPQFSTRGGQST